MSSAGLLWLAMALLFLPAGVRSIRAEDGAERLMSVDPALVSTAPSISEAPPGAQVIRAGDTDPVLRPRIAGSEVQPGVIVLNMRGYNYGPMPVEPDPGAIGIESKTR